MIPLSGSAKIAAWPGSHHLSVLYTTEADCSRAGDPDAKKMLEMLPEELRVDDGEWLSILAGCQPEYSCWMNVNARWFTGNGGWQLKREIIEIKPNQVGLWYANLAHHGLGYHGQLETASYRIFASAFSDSVRKPLNNTHPWPNELDPLLEKVNNIAKETHPPDSKTFPPKGKKKKK
jgi:hypothetical protein